MQLSTKPSESLGSESDLAVRSDLAIRNRRVEQSLWLVRSIAGELLRRHRFSMTQEDLESSGAIGLLEAADAFDERVGTRFTTFAYYRIRGAMLDAVRDGGGTATKSELVAMRRLAEENSRAADEALDRLTIVDHELAGVVAGISSLGDDDGHTPQTLVERSRLAEHVRAAVGRLPAQERSVLEALYYDCDLSFEGASRELGLNRGTVFRVHKRAIDLLRAELTEQPLDVAIVPGAGLDDLVDRKVEEEHLRAAVQTLPPRERELVEHLYFEPGASLATAAAKFGRDRSSLCRLHARALKQLRKALAALQS